MAVGYAVRFADLPTRTEYQAKYPNMRLMTFEEAAEHLGMTVKSVQGGLNRAGNRLKPAALEDDKSTILFSEHTLNAWREISLKKRRQARAYMDSMTWGRRQNVEK